MDQLLSMQNVSVSYRGREALSGVDVTVAPGEILAVVGESGSGKSTLLKAVTGLTGPGGSVRGRVTFCGRELTAMKDRERRSLLGSEIGSVYQDAGAALCPVRTIGSQIHEQMSAHGRVSRDKALQTAADILSRIGFTDTERILMSYPFELSGGQKQRVGIAMAMMTGPKLLLADEPTSALDVTVQKQAAEEILALRKLGGTAVILVTHNIALAGFLADRVMVLKDGRVRELGVTKEVLSNPGDPYTKLLLSSVLTLKKRKSI